MNVLPRQQVLEAVSTLRKIESTKSKSSLLDEEDGIYISLNLQKLPQKADHNSTVIKLRLPHTTLKGDACLFVGDLDRKNRDSIDNTIQLYEEKLRSAGVTQITEVIPLLKLKLEYTSYESKRLLPTRFDAFLAEGRVMRLLPRLLGKAFYNPKNKIHPIQVDLSKSKIETEVKKALSTSQCIITGNGSCSTVLVARVDMSDEQIVENVDAAFKTLCERIPGGLDNIRSAHLKLKKSASLPVFVSKVDRKSVPIPSVRTDTTEEDDAELMEEVSTIKGKVVVSRDGTVTILKPDGSIQQVIGGKSNPVKQKRALQYAKSVAEDLPAKKAKNDSDDELDEENSSDESGSKRKSLNKKQSELPDNPKTKGKGKDEVTESHTPGSRPPGSSKKVKDTPKGKRSSQHVAPSASENTTPSLNRSHVKRGKTPKQIANKQDPVQESPVQNTPLSIKSSAKKGKVKKPDVDKVALENGSQVTPRVSKKKVKSIDSVESVDNTPNSPHGVFSAKKARHLKTPVSAKKVGKKVPATEMKPNKTATPVQTKEKNKLINTPASVPTSKMRKAQLRNRAVK